MLNYYSINFFILYIKIKLNNNILNNNKKRVLTLIYLVNILKNIIKKVYKGTKYINFNKNYFYKNIKCK